MIVILMGVSGSGKTTVGGALARATGARFFDADDLHSAQNVEKMRSGEPLSEADRGPWLDALRRIVERWRCDPGLAVLACSALTTSSRARLGVGNPGVELVFLRTLSHVIRERMVHRRHFMPAALLESQLETLEPPAGALDLDASQPVEQLVAEIRTTLDI